MMNEEIQVLLAKTSSREWKVAARIEEFWITIVRPTPES